MTLGSVPYFLSFSLPWADEKAWVDISQAVLEHFLGEIEISLKVRIVTHFHWSIYLTRRKLREKLIQEAVLWWEEHMVRSQGNPDSKANLLHISCDFGFLRLRFSCVERRSSWENWKYKGNDGQCLWQSLQVGDFLPVLWISISLSVE